MCGTCGCNQPGHTHDHDHDQDHGGAKTIDIKQSVLSFNDRLAEQNRGFFRAHGIRAINLLSSPGSGKTTLIEETLKRGTGTAATGIIVGDLETENDAERIRKQGAPAVQITTGEVCHLDAHMVQHALEDLTPGELDVLFIENVGNLVCPASFDLGEEARVVLLSCTEGEDKPLKYPVIFNGADLVLLTKMDIAGPVEFERDQAVENVRKVAPKARIIELSARSGSGMDEWMDWLLGSAAIEEG